MAPESKDVEPMTAESKDTEPLAAKSKDIEPIAEDATLELDCYDIQQFLELEKKFDKARELNIDPENFNLLQVRNIDQAVILSKEISETKDEHSTSEYNYVDTEIPSIKNQQILNLRKFNDLLEHTDQGKVGKEKSSRTKTLNPLSKCFVPKSYGVENSKFHSQAVFNAPKYSNSISMSKTEHKRAFPIEASCEKFKFKEEMKSIWHVRQKEEISTYVSSNSSDHSLRSQVTKQESGFRKLYDSVWSVREEDKKILAPRVVTTPCGCPPAFGFNIPPDFFGNPFNLKPICSVHGIHASYFVEEKSQIEDIPRVNFPSKMPLDFLPDSESNSSATDKFKELRLIEYRKTFENCVSEIRSITEIMESIELDEGISSDEDKALETKDTGKESGLCDTLGNENVKLPLSDTNSNSLPSNCLEDNDLMNHFNRCMRLWQCYFGNSFTRPLCNPPCSVWCDSNKSDKLWGWNKTNVEAKASQLHATRKLTNENSKYSQNFKKTSGSENVVPRVSLQANETRSLDKIHALKDLKTDVNPQSNSTRSRHGSGDSGYGGSSTISGGIGQKASEKVDGWLDFESSYWTPLPDCLPQQPQEGTSIKKNQSIVNACNRWPLKTQKPRFKNQGFNESTESRLKYTMAKVNNYSNVQSHQRVYESHWHLTESDFPTLK